MNEVRKYVDKLLIDCVQEFSSQFLSEEGLWRGLLEKKWNYATMALMSQTYQPKKRKRARAHGFLKRAKTPGGRKTVKRRRQKGRTRVVV